MFKLALSAGHYLKTSGKRCLKSLDTNETKEWVLNNRICDKIEELLKTYPDCAVLRLDDTTGQTDVTLSTRSNKANAWGADLYLAIHHNAGIGGGRGGGLMAYVYTSPSATSVDWQKCFYNAIIASTGLKGNRATPLARANLHEVREPKCAAVLLECGFMDSATDVPIILTEHFANQVAQSCVNVIITKMNLAPIHTTVNVPITTNLYRVAKAYEDGKYVGQIGAFAVLNNAKLLCDKNTKMYVFDSNGKIIYPILGAITLNNVPLYATAATTKVSAYKTGTYYLWDNQPVHGRYRITNALSRVGVAGQVTGWIDEKYI